MWAVDEKLTFTHYVVCSIVFEPGQRAPGSLKLLSCGYVCVCICFHLEAIDKLVVWFGLGVMFLLF